MSNSNEELSNEQLVALIKLGRTELMEQLFTRNLPLIKKFIRPYVANRPQDMEDCLQEAYFGLYSAVEHYDCDREIKFATFSQWYIIRAVEKYLYNSTLIRLPQYMYEKISKYKKAYATLLTQQHGKPPTMEALSDFTGISPPEQQKLLSLMRGPVSLDAEIQTTDGDGDISLMDMLPSEEELEENVIDALYKSDMRATLRKVLHENLTEREEFIITQTAIYNKSLREVARETNLTHERIRQIRESALRKLYIRSKDFLEAYAEAEGLLYRGGFNTFVNTGESSTERVAIKHLEAQERYEEETKLELQHFKERIKKGA